MTEDGNNGGHVTVRDYVERIFDEREKALNLAFSAQQQALAIATTNLDNKLEKLNELRQVVTESQGRTVTRDRYDQDIKGINAWQDRMDGGLNLLRVLSFGGGFALFIEIARAFGWIK